jgi:phosphohistidine phosphatase
MVIAFLVRHADAIPEHPGLPDAARHLTDDGRRAARYLGDRLRWYDCVPTAIWISPAVRAVQTAELLLAGLGWEGPVEVLPALAPGADIRTVPPQIRALPADAHLILVGHEPGISGLGSVLTARSDFPALRKAQMARLDCHQGDAHMELRWLFGPGDDAPVPVVS